MTDDKNKERDVPDVEAIMAGIQRDIAEARSLAPDEPPDDFAAETGLHENLAEANRLHAVGAVTGKTPIALVRRLMMRPLGALIAEINGFNARVVRVLNEIVRMLEGEDTASAGRVLEAGKRRTELLTQLSRRLAEYDALNLDERLRRLEEQIPQRDKPEEA